MKKIIVVFIVTVLFIACGGSPVDRALGQMEKAIGKVEKNKNNMTEDDWHALEKEVEEPLKTISDALEKGDVGPVKRLKIIALTTQWAAVLMEAGISGIEEQTGIDRENFGDELEKATKELEKATEALEKSTIDSIKN